MEKISIMTMQRRFSMQRAGVKNDFDNQKRQLQNEYTLKLQKLIYERDKKLLAIDSDEEEMLHQYRKQKKETEDKKD